MKTLSKKLHLTAILDQAHSSNQRPLLRGPCGQVAVGRANCVGPFLHADAHPPAYRAGKDESCLTKLTWVATAYTAARVKRRLRVAGACSSSARRQAREWTRWGYRVSEYDDLIEQAAAQLAGCIISPTPEREAALGRSIGEALRRATVVLTMGSRVTTRLTLVGCGRNASACA